MQAPAPPASRTIGKKVLDGVGMVEDISNSFLLDEGGETYLIDAGFSGGGQKILQAIGDAGAKVEEIRGILLTHQHVDHFGGAAKLHWVSQAPVAAHRMDAPAIEGLAPRVAPFLVRLLLHPHKVEVANRLEDGATVGPFTVVHLPGHTPGSAAFFHKARGFLFTGDALLVGKSGKLSLSRPSTCYDPQGAVASLKKLHPLTGVKGIFPGHGTPLLDGAQEALAETIERLTQPKALDSPTFFGPEGRPELHPGTPGWRER